MEKKENTQKKKLSEMTLEELWILFPITLSKHKPCWKNWYKQEVELLKKLLPFSIKYYHIGSTVIKGILAKPIVDMLIVVNSKSELKGVSNILQKNGYILMAKQNNRISLNKGYTENGFAKKVFHLHVRLENDKDEIHFRDYLNKHFEVAKEYEELKLQLSKKYKYNRDAYTKAKTEFINKYTCIAKQ